jgi:hypothetical protein
VSVQVRPDTTPEVTARLRAAFLAVPIDESELENAVYAYVDDARTVGWPVERVIIYIKRLADLEQEAAMQAACDLAKRDESQRLLAQAITWCVEHYYLPR